MKGLWEHLELLKYLLNAQRLTCLQNFISDTWQIYNSKYSQKRKIVTTNPTDLPCPQKQQSISPGAEAQTQTPSKRDQQASITSKKPIEVICLDDPDFSPPVIEPPHQSVSAISHQSTPKPNKQVIPQARSVHDEPQSSLTNKAWSIRREGSRKSVVLSRRRPLQESIAQRFNYFQSNKGKPETPYSPSEGKYNIWESSKQSGSTVQLSESACSPCLRSDDGRMAALHLDAIRFLWYYLVENPCAGAIFAHGIGYPRAHLLFSFIQLLVGWSTGIREGYKILIVCPSDCLYEWKYAEECYKEFLYTLIPSDSSCFEDLRTWSQKGGLMICPANLYISMTENTDGDKRKQALEALCAPGPDLVILDEASFLNSPGSHMCTTLRRTKTMARLAMTSVSSAANLTRSWIMADWVCPQFLGNRSEFWHLYLTPISKGYRFDAEKAEREHALQISSHLCRKLQMIGFEVNLKCRESTLENSEMYVQESIVYVNMHRPHYHVYQDLAYCMSQAFRRSACCLISASQVLSLFTCSTAAARACLMTELSHLHEEEALSSIDGVKMKSPVNSKVLEDLLSIIDQYDQRAAWSSKFEVLRFLASACMNDNERLVIYVSSEELKLEVKKYLKDTLLRGSDMIYSLDYWSGTESDIGNAQLDTFNQAESGAILIAPYGPDVNLMEGAGWGFVNASRIIFIDALWHHAAWVQAVNRVHNFAQRSRIVYIHHILASGSVEEVLCSARTSQLAKNEMKDQALPPGQILPLELSTQLFDSICSTSRKPVLKEAKLERQTSGGKSESSRDHYNFLKPLIGVTTEMSEYVVSSVSLEGNEYLASAERIGVEFHILNNASSIENDEYTIQAMKDRQADVLVSGRDALEELSKLSVFDVPSGLGIRVLEEDEFFTDRMDSVNGLRIGWRDYLRLFESKWHIRQRTKPRLLELPGDLDHNAFAPIENERKRKREMSHNNMNSSPKESRRFRRLS